MKNGNLRGRLMRLAVLGMGLGLVAAPLTVHAEGEEAAILEALVSEGIAASTVSVSGVDVTVEYAQPGAEVNSVVDVLSKVGTVLAVIDGELPSAEKGIVVQFFDDGQIMQVSGAPGDGSAFVNRQLSAQEFMDALTFQPLTRGPLLVPGDCEPAEGETCLDYPECGCYPGETCDPSDPQANERGCVPGAAPANAHMVGSEYVCDDGYQWNADLSACVPVQQCPANAFFFDGDCHCDPGYEWNAAGTECVPIQADAGNGGTGGNGGSASSGDVGSSFKALIDALINWLKSLFG